MYATFHSAFPTNDIVVSMIGRATMKILACDFRYQPPSVQTKALTPAAIADDHHVTWELEPAAITSHL
jgi:hypothetical protein